MKKTVAAGCLLAGAIVTSAYAATTTLTAAPQESWTVTNYYKQAIYDPPKRANTEISMMFSLISRARSPDL